MIHVELTPSQKISVGVGSTEPVGVKTGGQVFGVAENDYEKLKKLPQINGNTVIGNKTGTDLGLVDEGDLSEYSYLEILNLWNNT